MIFLFGLLQKIRPVIKHFFIKTNIIEWTMPSNHFMIWLCEKGLGLIYGFITMKLILELWSLQGEFYMLRRRYPIINNLPTIKHIVSNVVECHFSFNLRSSAYFSSNGEKTFIIIPKNVFSFFLNSFTYNNYIYI